MKIVRSFFAPLLFFIACPSLAGTLHAVEYGSISVKEFPMADRVAERTEHGYVEYRFTVTNQDSRSHTVELSLQGSGSGETALARTTGGVEIPAKTSVVMRLLQPPVAMASGHNEARVSIDGRQQRDGTPFTKIDSHFERYYSSSSVETAHVFYSQSVSNDHRDLIRSGYTPPSGGTSPTPTHHGSSPDPPVLFPNGASLQVEGWSESWLAYTRFDCVAMTVEDWNALEGLRPAVLGAVRKYVEAGGVLCIVGDGWKAPKEWIREPGSEDRYQAVFGRVCVLSANLKEAQKQVNGFRDIVLQGSRTWSNILGGSLGYRRYGGYSSSGMMGAETPLLQSMPVLANYGIHVKLIMILIIVFAVLIGPVNIYVLSVIKRRIWLLWTVPVTSLVASLLVLGVSFIQEGFIKQCSSVTITVLDQRRGEATTVGYVGFYSTLTPRGIMFSPDTEATPCIDRGYSSESRSLELNLVAGGNQFLSRGWIHARVPAYFGVRKAESQRKERITFDWSAQPPTATNGLGTDIRRLDVCGPDGKLYSADSLAAGSKVPLNHWGSAKPTETALAKSVQISGQQILHSGPGASPADRGELVPGSYLAEIETWNPFIEPGIENLAPYQNRSTILGFFD